MPLPRSLTCSSCQHTYPEGWKRCPYCGFDPEKQKRDRQIERALVKKFPSYAASVNAGGGQNRREQSRRDRRPDPAARASTGSQAQESRDGASKRSRRRRGRRRGGAQGAAPQQQAQESKPNPPQQSRERPRNDEPRPRVDGPVPQGDSPQQPNSQAGADGQTERTRRRRPRRRRKPGGGSGGGAETRSDS